MKTRLVTASAAAVALCLVAAELDQAPSPVPHVCEHTLPAGIYTRTAVLDLDGDCINDTAYLVNDHVEFLMAPALFEARVSGPKTPDGTTALACNDVAPVDRPGSDTLLAVGPGGLYEVSWVQNAVGTQDRVVAGLVFAGAWAGAVAIRTWSREPGTVHACALTATRDVVLRAHCEDNGAWIEDVAVLCLNAPASDLLLLDLDGADEDAGTAESYLPELAVQGVTASGHTIDVHDDIAHPGGGHLTYAAGNLQLIEMARLRHGDREREWLVSLSTMPGAVGQQYLSVASEAGVLSFCSLGPGHGYNRVATGRCDGDEFDDVVLSGTATWDLTRYTNQAVPPASPSQAQPNPSFTAAANDVLVTGVAGPASDNQAAIALGDYDDDGDCDVAFPRQVTSSMWVWLEPAINHDVMRPGLSANLNLTAGGPARPVGAWVEAPQTLVIGVTRPQQPAGEFLEIAVWRKAGLNSPLISTAVTRRTHALAEPEPIFVEHIQIPGDPSPGNPSDPALFGSIVYVVVQTFDAASETAPPTARYPAFSFVVEAQGASGVVGVETAAAQFVLGAVVPGSDFDVFTEPPFGSTSLPPTGQDVGTGGHVLCLPSPPNDPPRR